MSSAEFPAGFEGHVQYIKAPQRSSVADTANVVGLVGEILAAVRTRGDAAVKEYSQRFDGTALESFEVSATDRAAAVEALDPQTRADTEFAIENVRRFAQ